MRHRLARLREALRTGFWAVPALCVAVAVLLALGLVRLDRAVQDGFGGQFTFGAGPDGAREVLSAITTSMITFTGLVFSITIVVLQLTSSQFSPRVLRTFLRDRVTQFSLGIFVATFVYAVMVLRTVSSTDETVFVPAVATTVGVVVLLVAVGVFVNYIHHIATAIQVSSLLSSIAGETRAAVDRVLPAGTPPAPSVLRPRGEPSVVVPAPRSGVLVSVDARRLARLAAEADVVVVSVVAAGEFVPEGAELFSVRGPDVGRFDLSAALRTFTLGKERTMQQDVAFGLRQLVDIAERALSPGINDPTTAVQALDAVHDVLRRVATRHLPTGVVDDDQGRMRVFLPPCRFEDLLTLGVEEVDHYAKDAPTVQRRLDVLLADLHAAALPEHRPAVAAQIAARGRDPGGAGEAGPRPAAVR